MFRKLIFVLLVLALSLTACAPIAPTAFPSEAATPTFEYTPPPVAYIDALDRHITIATKPTRIVSLAPSVTEILFAIGAGPQMVGRTKFCNYPPEATSLPEIGGFSAKSISVEAILALEPDLVVAGSKSQREVVSALEGQGIKVFVLAPETLSDIEIGILMLGEITGNLQARDVAESMQARITEVTTKIKTIPSEKRLRVFYEVWHEPLTTTTQSTFIGEVLMLAGAANIFGELEGTYPEVSAEQIFEMDPQAIVGPSSHSDQLSAQVISTRPGWDRLSAVKNGAVYIVDSEAISRAGPRIVDALEAIAAMLYPNLFGN